MLSQDEQWLLKEKYQGEKSEGFFADCECLKAGEPLAYVIGWIPFLNCKIFLSSDSEFVPPSPASPEHGSDQRSLPTVTNGIKAKHFALIPRTETEFWTEKALTAINARPESKVLDLCAGSGAIGVAVASASRATIVHFAELDQRHLPTIKKNLEANGIEEVRTNTFQSDLFGNVSDTYDFILTNPPYIDPTLDRTESSVKQFEPEHALYGGKLGLEFIEAIIAGAPAFLNPSGELWIEHEPEQAAAIQVLGARAGFSPTTHIDQYGIARYSVLMLE